MIITYGYKPGVVKGLRVKVDSGLSNHNNNLSNYKTHYELILSCVSIKTASEFQIYFDINFTIVIMERIPVSTVLYLNCINPENVINHLLPGTVYSLYLRSFFIQVTSFVFILVNTFIIITYSFSTTTLSINPHKFFIINYMLKHV